jgi:pimeloyl-ACP methyl ester carboxylesterase
MPHVALDDGTPIFHTDRGEGRPLVLLQGLQFSSSYFWQKNLPALASDNRVIAVDTRGQGQSGKPMSGYTIAQAAADLHELFIKLDLRDVCLSGVAFGGLVILEYLRSFGSERLRSICLCEMTPRLLSEPGWPHPTFGDFPPEAGYAYAADVRRDRGVLQDFLYAAFATPPDPATIAEMQAQMYLTPTSVVADLIDDMVRQDFRSLLPSVRLPTLLIYGRGNNPVMPGEIGRWMASQITGAELIELPAAGHSPFWEDPEGFNSALGGFAQAH